MNISFLVKKNQAWAYQSGDQQSLLNECRAWLDWNIFDFDMWLFCGEHWKMYTRGRQITIERRVKLADDYQGSDDSLEIRKLLIADFAIQAWSAFRNSEFRNFPEIQKLELACKQARKIRNVLMCKPHFRKTNYLSQISSAAYGQPLHMIRNGQSINLVQK